MAERGTELHRRLTATERRVYWLHALALPRVSLVCLWLWRLFAAIDAQCDTVVPDTCRIKFDSTRGAWYVTDVRRIPSLAITV